jgi:hypothetical protein
VKTIELKDVGPVASLSIPIPEGGGVVVLRGRNGFGKTRSLEAVASLVGGSAKISSRDGSPGAIVTGLNARITVGRKLSRSGELDVEALDGEDPSLLVDPNRKDPESADAERVRALLRLARAQVGADAFAPLVGGIDKLRALCRPGSLEDRDGDVPAMAAAIKRDLEGEARKRELGSDALFSKAEGMKATVTGLGEGDAPTTCADSAEARERHTQAVREHSAAEARRKQADQATRASTQARGALASLGEDGTAASLEGAQATERELQARVQSLHDQWTIARGELATAVGMLAMHERAAKQREQLQRTLDATVAAEPVDDATMAALAAALQAAAAEVDTWAVRDRTRGLLADVEKMRAEALELSCEGAELRNAAKNTESVVLQAVRDVCGEGMELSDGRLYVHTDRGRELFSDLSQGERWRRSLDITVAAVGSKGLVVCRQEAYESLDPQNRAELADYARKLGVVILTAEAAEGELRAEVA